jgi:hypothetical protein
VGSRQLGAEEVVTMEGGDARQREDRPMLEFHGKSAASRKVDGMSAKRKVSVSIAKSYESDTSM